MKKKKILYVISDLNIAGAQRVVVDLACYISRKGFQVGVAILYCEMDKEYISELQRNDVVFFSYNRNGLSIPEKIGRYRFLAKTIKEFSPSVIHGHLDYKYLWIYSLLHNRRIIETFHSQAYRINSKKFRLLYWLLSRRGLIVSVCLTRSGAKEFYQLFKPKERVRIIPDPIKIEKEQDDRKYDKEHGNDLIRFVFAARFHPIKNHELLVRAFAKYLETKKGLLFLAGEGETKGNIEKLCEELAITEQVIMCGEINNVSELISTCDVGVISSDSESFSVFLLECMKEGLPVVTTNVGGIKDILKGNGILVRKGDVNGFAEAMIKVASSTSMREQMGIKARRIIKRYDIERIGKQYWELYEKYSAL